MSARQFSSAALVPISLIIVAPSQASPIEA
jgi:hypothetical protein